MRIEVRLFAAAAQAVQARSVIIEVEPPATLADLVDKLAESYPQLQPLLGISRWAIDCDFVPLETTIGEQKEIAMIPPVSGG